MTTRNKTSHIPPFGLRMQPELKSVLEVAAAENGRSLNAEIVARLEQSLNPQPSQPFDIEQYQHFKRDILQDLIKAIEEREKARNLR